MNRNKVTLWLEIFLLPAAYMAVQWIFTGLLSLTGVCQEISRTVIGLFLLPLLFILYRKNNPLPRQRVSAGSLMQKIFLTISCAVFLVLLSMVLGGKNAERSATPFWDMAGAVFIGPINEELVYRGFSLSKSRELMKTPWAVFLNACLFAAAHTGILQMGLSFLAGAMFSMLVICCGNLIFPSVSHICVNLVLTRLELVPVAPAIGGIIGGGVLFCAFYIYRKKNDFRHK